MKSHIILSLVATLALAACGEKADTTPAATEPAAMHALLGTIPHKEAAVDVAAARALAPGEPVTLRARLIGAADIFADQQAMLILGDPAYVKPNYAKPKPHLACCTPAELKAAHTITAQATDAEGLPLPYSLKGLGGLKELDYVIISGSIAPESTPQAPLLNISTIERVAPWLDGDAPLPGMPTCN